LKKCRRLEKKITEERDIKEDPLHSYNKESSNLMMESTEEKIVINRGMNLKGLHQKEDHSLPGIKIYFMVIVLISFAKHRFIFPIS
jgi:hypothetical protein